MSDLVQRLRGHYSIPINDGHGPIDGKDTFDRKFDTPPIQHEAAARIEELEAKVKELEEREALRNDPRWSYGG